MNGSSMRPWNAIAGSMLLANVFNSRAIRVADRKDVAVHFVLAGVTRQIARSFDLQRDSRLTMKGDEQIGFLAVAEFGRKYVFESAASP